MTVICGADIVHVKRVAELIEKEEVVKKFFHQSELSNPDPEHLAGIIAAKEAFFKALGKVPKFTDVEVIYEESGRPKIKASPEWSEYSNCDLSISHDGDYAIAMVVIER